MYKMQIRPIFFIQSMVILYYKLKVNKSKGHVYMKRAMAMMLTAAMGVTLLAGCGISDNKSTENAVTEDNSSGKKEKAVKLRVWSSESDMDLTNQMIESFKEANSGTEFEITVEEAEDSAARDNLLGNVHGAADVFPVADDQITSMVAGGALYPVSDVDTITAANDEGAIEAATVDDTLYAYPMTADNGYFMYYNKNYFSDSDVATLDGMLSIAAANGKYVTMDWSSGWYLYSFFGNTGLDFGVNDDGLTNHCNWNAIITQIKGVDIAQALLDIAANPGFKSCVDTDFVAGVQDGSVIAGVSGCWNATQIKEAWGDDYGAVKLPTYTCAGQQIQMASFKGYKYMAVNAYTSHPEWAAKLAEWFTNEDNQKLRFEQKDQGPANKNAAADDAVSKVPAIAAVMDQAQYGKLQRVGNSYWDATSSFGETMAAGNPSHTDLQELMDSLVSEITKTVSN